MRIRPMMDLQPWNKTLALEPHSCGVCNNVVIGSEAVETEVNSSRTHEYGRRAHKYVICDFAEQVQLKARGEPTGCGFIQHHMEHRGPALDEAIQRRVDPRTSDLLLEVHSAGNNDYNIRTAYTMFWGQRLAEFNVYATEDDPAARYVLRRPKDRDPASDRSLNLLRMWLNTCLESHEACPKPDASHLPTRVLDVSTENLRLYTSVPSETGLYTALSYCWGGPQSTRATVDNLEALKKGIDYNDLPKTLQDAILVTRKIMVRYLWIDSLCIVQDDPVDMAREIERMPQVYKEAYATLSAECAKTCHDGFLHEHPPPMSAYWSFRLPYRCPDGELGHVILENRQPTNASDEPIHARAWTLQETLLSPRFIGFGGLGIEWRCPSYRITDEMVEADTDDSQFLKGQRTIPYEHHYLFPQNSLSFHEYVSDEEKAIDSIRIWHDMVEAYTARQLTAPSDKLPAISAIAQELAPRIGSHYLAGLWKRALAHELLWKVDQPLRRPAEWRAPTWSWASVDGIIDYAPMPDADIGDSRMELIDWNIQPRCEVAPFGQLAHASITIKVHMKQVYWVARPTTLCDPLSDAYNTQLPLEITFDADEDHGDSIFCVEMLPPKPGFRPYVTGLVLARDYGADTFKRIGYFEMNKFTEPEHNDGHGPECELLCKTMYGMPVVELADWFANCEAQTITIV